MENMKREDGILKVFMHSETAGDFWHSATPEEEQIAKQNFERAKQIKEELTTKVVSVQEQFDALNEELNNLNEQLSLVNENILKFEEVFPEELEVEEALPLQEENNIVEDVMEQFDQQNQN